MITFIPTENKNEVVLMVMTIVKGDPYIRASDVAVYIRKLAETEKADTRERLNFAAENINNMRPIV